MKRRNISIWFIFLLSLLMLMTAPESGCAADQRPVFADSVSGQLLPLLQARGAILIDADSGETIFSVNEQQRLYPASTTKILTALLAVEHGDLDDRVRVGDEISLTPSGSSQAGLKIGEVISLRELIYGLMLPSGNDAALTVAVHTARECNPGVQLSTSQALKIFVDMMNHRAIQLGAKNSHFTNPHGFQDPGHYTTPADLALIARQAISNPFLRQVVSCPDYSGMQSGQSRKHSARVWTNTNELLQRNNPFFYEEGKGIKTGHTAQAGFCLVSMAVRENSRLLAVVMNSTESGVYTDSIYLLKYGLAHYRPHPAVSSRASDQDYPYAPNAWLIVKLMLLGAGVYAATRLLEGWARSRIRDSRLKRSGNHPKRDIPY